MKKSVFTAFLVSAFIVVPTAQATFIDRGNGLIYDDVLDVTWLQDANYAYTSGYDTDGRMTWDDASLWAANLSVEGYDDWRLPTYDPSNPRPITPTSANEFGSLWSQLGGGDSIFSDADASPFFNLPFNNDMDIWYWTGLEYDADPSRAWRMSMSCACWDAPLKSNEYFVWAVRDGDVAVPEPATVALLGLGIAGIGFARRKNL